MESIGGLHYQRRIKPTRDQGFQESGPLSLWSTLLMIRALPKENTSGSTRDIEKKSERNVVVSSWG